MQKKIKELLMLLGMEDGMPYVQVYYLGSTLLGAISDERVVKILMELAKEVEEPSDK